MELLQYAVSFQIALRGLARDPHGLTSRPRSEAGRLVGARARVRPHKASKGKRVVLRTDETRPPGSPLTSVVAFRRRPSAVVRPARHAGGVPIPPHPGHVAAAWPAFGATARRGKATWRCLEPARGEGARAKTWAPPARAKTWWGRAPTPTPTPRR